MKKFIYQIIVGFIFFTSCKKSVEILPPVNGEKLDSAWTNNITSASQVLVLSKELQGNFSTASINLSADTLLNTTAFQISLPKNGLIVNGSTFSGSLNVEYTLIQKKGDFIRYGISTVVGTMAYESGGALKIKLSSNGQAVSVSELRKISIRYKDEEPKQGMRIFYGNTAIITNPFAFQWALATDSSSVKVWDSSATVPSNKGYIIETNKTGWVSPQKVLLETISARTEAKVYLPDLFSNANTSVYVSFNNYRSVVQLSGNVTGRYFSFLNLPLNQDIKIITISKVSSSYYLGVKAEKTVANMAVFVKPELSSMAAIQSVLSSL